MTQHFLKKSNLPVYEAKHHLYSQKKKKRILLSEQLSNGNTCFIPLKAWQQVLPGNTHDAIISHPQKTTLLFDKENKKSCCCSCWFFVFCFFFLNTFSRITWIALQIAGINGKLKASYQVPQGDSWLWWLSHSHNLLEHCHHINFQCLPCRTLREYTPSQA